MRRERAESAMPTKSGSGAVCQSVYISHNRKEEEDVRDMEGRQIVVSQGVLVSRDSEENVWIMEMDNNHAKATGAPNLLKLVIFV